MHHHKRHRVRYSPTSVYLPGHYIKYGSAYKDYMQILIRDTRNNNFILIYLKSILNELAIIATKIDFKAEIGTSNETLENDFAHNA